MIDSSAGESGGTAAIAAPEGGSPSADPGHTPDSASVSTTPDQSATSKGPVPYDRFDQVNTKYNALKWAEAHDPARVQQQAQFFQWLDADPAGAHEYITRYLERAGVLKSAARVEAPHEGRPQADVVVPETGQRFYSAEAAEKLAEWQAKQAVAPIESRLNSFESDRAYAKASAEAARQLSEAETWPHYKAHEAAILKEMERDQRLSLEGAYNRVVLPQIRTLERQAMLTELQQKSRASTTNPGSTTATLSAPASTLSFAELFKREVAKRGSV